MTVSDISSPPLRVRSASELVQKEIRWLWDGWLPLGNLALVDGDPGLGKSLLTLDLCARLSTGRPQPDGSASPGPASSLVLNAEDSAENTIRGRLEALGACRDRVFVVDCAENGWITPVGLPSQWTALDQVIGQHEAKLVIIDPMMAFLDRGIQANSDQSVRRVLEPLRQIAVRHECSILMVRHLNKDGRGQARYRGSGSIGFQGACRATWLVERDPATPGGLVLAQVKNNLAGRQPSLAFSLTATGSNGALRTLAWGGTSPFSADQLLAAARRGAAQSPEVERACRFLEKLLENGPQSTPVIWEAGRALGLSERDLRRARGVLGVKSKRKGKGQEHRAYWWRGEWPQTDEPEEKAAHDEVDLSRWLDPLIKAYPPATPLDDDI
jgi:RecA-family ATPase